MSVISKHKDGMGKASLSCIEYRPWGNDPPENQRPVGKHTATCRDCSRLAPKEQAILPAVRARAKIEFKFQ